MINPVPLFTQIFGFSAVGNVILKNAGKFFKATRKIGYDLLKKHILTKEILEHGGKPLNDIVTRSAVRTARKQYQSVYRSMRRIATEAEKFAGEMSPFSVKTSRALGRFLGGGHNQRVGTWALNYAKNELAIMPVMYAIYRYDKTKSPEMRDMNFAHYYASYLPISLAFGALSSAGRMVSKQMRANFVHHMIDKGRMAPIGMALFHGMNAVSRQAGENMGYVSHMKQEVFKNRHWQDFTNIRGLRRRAKDLVEAHRDFRLNKRSIFSEDIHVTRGILSAADAHANLTPDFAVKLARQHREMIQKDEGIVKWVKKLFPDKQKDMFQNDAVLGLSRSHAANDANVYFRDRGLIRYGEGESQVFDVRAFHMGKIRDLAANALDNFNIMGLAPFKKIITGRANYLRSSFTRTARSYIHGAPNRQIIAPQYKARSLQGKDLNTIFDNFSASADPHANGDLRPMTEKALADLLGPSKDVKVHAKTLLDDLWLAHNDIKFDAGNTGGVNVSRPFQERLLRNLQQGILPLEKGSIFRIDENGYGTLLNGHSGKEYTLAGGGRIKHFVENNKSNMAEHVARGIGFMKIGEGEGSYYVGVNYARPRSPGEIADMAHMYGVPTEDALGWAYAMREKWDIGSAGVKSVFSMISGFFEKMNNPRNAVTWFTKEAKGEFTKLTKTPGGETFKKAALSVFEDTIVSSQHSMFDFVTMQGKHYGNIVSSLDAMGLKDAGKTLGSMSLHGVKDSTEAIDRLLKVEQWAMSHKSKDMVTAVQQLRDLITTTNPSDVRSLLTRTGKSFTSSVGDDYESMLLHNFILRAKTTDRQGNIIEGIDAMSKVLGKAGYRSDTEIRAYSNIMKSHAQINAIKSLQTPDLTVPPEHFHDNVNDVINRLILKIEPEEEAVVKKLLAPGSQMMKSMFTTRYKYPPLSSDTVFLFGDKGSGTARTSMLYDANGQNPKEIANYTGLGHEFMAAALGTFNKTMGLLGVGIDHYANYRELGQKWITKRILPVGGLIAGLTAADRIIDNSTLFDNTPLKEGIYMLPMNAYAGMRLGAQGVLDTLGVTSTAKYLENWLPGSISSPLSGALRGLAPIVIGATKGFAAGGARGGITGGVIGGAVGMLLGGGPLGLFGEWDISKNRAETLAEFKGEKEVEIRTSRFWELGSNSFLGDKTSYFRPHMYAMMRSDYRWSPNFKSDLMTEMMSYVDPAVYNRKHYYSRPSLAAPGVFSNIPIIGPFVNLGNTPMHRDDVDMVGTQAAAQATANAIIHNRGTETQRLARATGMGASSMVENAFYGDPLEGDSIESRLSHGFYNLKEVGGLRGFSAEVLQDVFTGNKQLFSQTPEIDAPNIGSLGRSFWDMQLGGLMGLTEGIRRIFPRQAKDYEMYNPVRNLQPNWMPGSEYFTDFKHGDPYSKVDAGEARLPGEAYETLRNITPATPGEADMLGVNSKDAIGFYSGDVEVIVPRYQWADKVNEKKEEILALIKAEGKLMKEQSIVYDTSKNLTAYADATYQTDSGDIVSVKFAPYLAKAGGFIEGSKGAMNAYLVLSGQKRGLLVGIDEQGHTTEEIIQADQDKYEQESAVDLMNRQKGLTAMKKRYDEGLPVAPGINYSMIDRLQILADVAPFSDQYRSTLKIVRAQMNQGLLDENDIQVYQDTLDQVEKQRKSMNFMQSRFLNQGDALTPDEVTSQREVDDQYNPLERAIGGAWEYLSTFRNPITRKFIGNKTALQAYEEDMVYGQSFKTWNHPIDSYVSPYFNLMARETDPLQAAASGVTAGFAFGGPVGAALGGLAGTAWSLTGAQIVNGAGWIPDKTQKMRQILAAADQAEMERYKELYDSTGASEYRYRMKNTMTATLESNQVITNSRIASVSNKQERMYLNDILSELNTSNISEFRRVMPEEVSILADRSMGLQRDYLPGSFSGNYKVDPKIVSDYDQPLEDVAVKTMDNAGLNATDAGLGWQKTRRRMAEMQSMGMHIPEMTIEDIDGPRRKDSYRVDAQQVKAHLQRILSSMRPTISVEQSDGPMQVTIEIV